jgi:hypothetical protein
MDNTRLFHDPDEKRYQEDGSGPSSMTVIATLSRKETSSVGLNGRMSSTSDNWTGLHSKTQNLRLQLIH